MVIFDFYATGLPLPTKFLSSARWSMNFHFTRGVSGYRSLREALSVPNVSLLSSHVPSAHRNASTKSFPLSPRAAEFSTPPYGSFSFNYTRKTVPISLRCNDVKHIAIVTDLILRVYRPLSRKIIAFSRNEPEI